MTTSLRQSATNAAESLGFSSLQETVRLFLNQLTNKQITISFTPKTIKLSPAAEKRYLKLDKDIKSGKAVLYQAENINDLMDQLNDNKDPVPAKVS